MNSKSKLPKSIKIGKAKKICELYSRGEYTIAACCRAVDVEYNTFQTWAQPNLSTEDITSGNYRRGFVQDVHEIYKKALTNNQNNYKALLKDAVREGILKRARGALSVETSTNAIFDKYGNSIGVIIRKNERYMLPDTTSLIFLSKNLNLFGSGNASNNGNNSYMKNPYQDLTDEELKAKRLELESELANDKFC